MEEKKVISLEQYRASKLKKNKDNLLRSEENERIETLNLFMKVLETIHNESYK